MFRIGLNHSAWLLFTASVLLSSTGSAQTHLATRGEDQLVQGKMLFQMQPGEDYRVVGTPDKGGVYIATPIGAVAFPNASRFRVLPGGTFAADAAVTLKDPEAKATIDMDSATWRAEYSAQLISLQAMGHVYVAFQWYVAGEPVATEVRKIGTIKANDPVSLFFYVPITLAQKTGTYSIHVYSGYAELKQTEVKKGATW